MEHSSNNLSWHQIHLTTALVLMFVLGALIGLNLIPLETQYSYHLFYYGWPCELLRTEVQVEGLPIPDGPLWRNEIFPYVVNVVSNLGIIGAAVAISEWLIRRRK